MLRFRTVSKNYAKKGNPSVDKVSWEIGECEHVALVGESGCGKTTLLRLLAGLEVPTSGSITIGSSVVADENTWVPPEKRNVGLVFQGGALFPHLDVSKNIGYGLVKHTKNEKQKKVSELLNLIGLSEMAQKYPHELSGGERQRVALARALAPEPKAILLDEPFSNLDPTLRNRLRQELSRILRKIETTCILVTHDMADAIHFSDRIAIMRAGVIEQIGTSSEIEKNPASDYCRELFQTAFPPTK